MGLTDYRPPRDELIAEQLQVSKRIEDRTMLSLSFLYRCMLENAGFESRGCDMVKIIDNKEIVFTRLVRRSDGNHLYMRTSR